MKCTYLPKNLVALLTEVPYIAVATVCPDGRPWNTPVRGYFDDQLTLYWVSWVKNQHSQNIACDPRIFAVIYSSCAPEGTAVGLYLEMVQRRFIHTRQLYRRATRDFYKLTV